MSNGYDKPPFSAPPPIFMQTGNQTPVINEQVGDQENFGGEVLDVHDESPFGSQTLVQPGINAPPFGASVVNQPEIDIPPFGSPPNLMDTPAPTQEKDKYKILDLFWLLNSKYSKTPPEQPIQKEAHFVVLSYNISFGNLRMSFFDLTQNSISGNVAFLGNMKRTVSGTIYPMAAFNIVRKAKLDMTCMEQLFQDTGADWQHSRPVCQIQKDEAHIRLIVRDPKFGSYFYDFIDTQKDAFLLACQFVYTTGFNLMAQNMLK